jgi:hypothetical protein
VPRQPPSAPDSARRRPSPSPPDTLTDVDDHDVDLHHAVGHDRRPGVWELRPYLGRDPLTGPKRYGSRVVRATGKRNAQAQWRPVGGRVGRRRCVSDRWNLSATSPRTKHGPRCRRKNASARRARMTERVQPGRRVTTSPAGTARRCLPHASIAFTPWCAPRSAKLSSGAGSVATPLTMRSRARTSKRRRSRRRPTSTWSICSLRPRRWITVWPRSCSLPS